MDEPEFIYTIGLYIPKPRKFARLQVNLTNRFLSELQAKEGNKIIFELTGNKTFTGYIEE